jgi:hypothetical protein
MCQPKSRTDMPWAAGSRQNHTTVTTSQEAPSTIGQYGQVTSSVGSGSVWGALNRSLSVAWVAPRADACHITSMPKGPKGQRRPADMNQLAKAIVDIATGDAEETAPTRGRPGGLKGGESRAKNSPQKRRTEIARKAAEKRWRR